MKKIFGFLIGLLIMFSPAVAFSLDDTLTYTDERLAGDVRVMTWTCTGATAASGTTGYFTPTTSDRDLEGYVFLVVTNPGGISTSGVTPTSLYDITLTDSDGADIMGGELLDRSGTTTEQVMPLIKTTAYATVNERYVATPLTITITNNSIASAVVVVRIYYRKPR